MQSWTILLILPKLQIQWKPKNATPLIPQTSSKAALEFHTYWLRTSKLISKKKLVKRF